MPCFFFKKKSKSTHNVPPPSVHEADGVNARKQQVEERYTLTSSQRGNAPPPLPDRRTGEPVPSQGNGSAHHRIPVNEQAQNGGSPSMRNKEGKRKPPPISVQSRQLSQEILSTPVPISGQCVSTPQFALDNQNQPLDNEDYIEPTATETITNGGHPPSAVMSPSKVSLSEENKRVILGEYFSQNSVPNLNVVVPSKTKSTTSDDFEGQHDYKNVDEYPDTPATLATPHKPKQRLSKDSGSALPAPVPVSPLHSPRNDTPSDSDTLKSRSRRPRPVPRTGPNSRKTSLVSETGTEDSSQEFNYENVAEVTKHLSTDTTGSLPGSKPTTPRPLPRVRTTNETINSQLPVPTSPLSLQLSAPLPCDSKNFLNTGTYVFDAGYVPPNPKTPSGNNTPKHHSPIGKRISPPLPVLNNSDLDLSKPIPKAGGNVDVGLHNAKKKGYIPMDQSPHTQAALKSEAVGSLSSTLLASESIGLNLGYKVPAAAQSDHKAAGYLTIIDSNTAPSIPSGPYYNMNNHSDYYNNPDLLFRPDNPYNNNKSAAHKTAPAAAEESPYYG